MIELPMLTFNLSGENEYISLEICEIFGFPKEKAYGGGYGAKGILSIKVGSYLVKADHYFTTGELFDFYIKLQDCYKSISGDAVLKNTEHELQLTLSFKNDGKVIAYGNFQEFPTSKNKLIFEMKTDQTQVFYTLKDLKKFMRILDFKGLVN